MDIWIVSILAIMNTAAMNIHVQGFVWIYVFSSLGYTFRSQITGSNSYTMFSFLKNCQTVF